MVDAIEGKLGQNSWLGGQQPSKEDAETFASMANNAPNSDSHPESYAWWVLCSRFSEEVRGTWAAGAPAAAQQKAPEESKKADKGGKKEKKKKGVDQAAAAAGAAKESKPKKAAPEEEKKEVTGDDAVSEVKHQLNTREETESWLTANGIPFQVSIAISISCFDRVFSNYRLARTRLS